jgi:hypothetical protein
VRSQLDTDRKTTFSDTVRRSWGGTVRGSPGAAPLVSPLALREAPHRSVRQHAPSTPHQKPSQSSPQTKPRTPQNRPRTPPKRPPPQKSTGPPPATSPGAPPRCAAAAGTPPAARRAGRRGPGCGSPTTRAGRLSERV